MTQLTERRWLLLAQFSDKRLFSTRPWSRGTFQFPAHQLLNFVCYRGPALRYIQVRGFVVVRVCNLSPLSGFKSQGAVKGDSLFVGKFVYRLAHKATHGSKVAARKPRQPIGADNWRGCVQPPFEANAAAPVVYQTDVKELYREAIHAGHVAFGGQPLYPVPIAGPVP
jgi:hypothetical protein